MLDKITPVILTYNEAPNIARTLEGVRWARDIVIVDSFSTDATLDEARRFPQVRIFQRAFASHSDQWNYACFETGISSEWILALDADYLLTPDAVEELRALDPAAADGYRASFRYCIWGKEVRGALYPAVTVLFRKARGVYEQDGHTHRLRLDGAVAPLTHAFLHDDRKSLSHWLVAQDRYMRLEAAKIGAMPWSSLKRADRLRRLPPLAPLAVFFYSYLLKGGWRDGRAGLYYALQRMLAESLLALRLIHPED